MHKPCTSYDQEDVRKVLRAQERADLVASAFGNLYLAIFEQRNT